MAFLFRNISKLGGTGAVFTLNLSFKWLRRLHEIGKMIASVSFGLPFAAYVYNLDLNLFFTRWSHFKRIYSAGRSLSNVFDSRMKTRLFFRSQTKQLHREPKQQLREAYR